MKSLLSIVLTLFLAASMHAQNTLFPQNLVAFKAEIMDNTIQLSWSTSSEINISHYDLERSSDGFTFLSRQSVTAAGSTSQQQNYQCSDKNDHAEVYYYRLRAVSADGLSSYSEIISVMQSTCGYKVFPNPSLDGITNVTIPEPTEVLITGPTGRTVFRKQYSEAGSYEIAFKASALKDNKGIYYLNFITAKGIVVRRLICQ